VSLGTDYGDLVVHPLKPTDRRADREVILLLHGLGGSRNDWQYPQSRELNFEHSTPKNRSSHNKPTPPLELPFLDISRADFDDEIRCWAGVLEGLGHTVINYSQDGNQEEVSVPLAQLEETIVPFIRENVLVDQLQGKRVTVLCHSRGGILIRKYLADAASTGGDAAIDWIGKVITVATPHGGTMAPLAKSRIGDIVNRLLLVAALFGNPVIGAVLHAVLNKSLDFYDVTPGARQLLPGNPLFDELARPAETPSVDYYTFGGSSVTFSGLYYWHYTPGSYVPTSWDFSNPIPAASFDWTEVAVEIPLISPLLDSIPNVLLYTEQIEGMGDGAVTITSSQLAGTPHQTLSFNHAEGLWDEGLFDRVATLLGTPIDTEAGSPTDLTDPRHIAGCNPAFVSDTNTRELQRSEGRSRS
jgi:pimeloyl-ACP methyl ester carboxylesterase